MDFIEMTRAIAAAESTLRVADDHSDRLARLLVGRMRKVSSNRTLAKLKKELSQFNAHTGQWKEDK